MEKMLDLYTDYLISQNGYATATGMSSICDVSHDKITRHLNMSNYNSKELWLEVKDDVRKHENEDDGALILDDSIEEKPYTDENEIMCWHYSHAKGRHVKGVNILSSIVQYGNISIPIGYEIVHKDIQFSDVKTKKLRRKSSATKNEHFRTLIQRANSNKVLYNYVLADNWFGSSENLKYIRDSGKNFIVGIKANRTVALLKDDKTGVQFQNVSTLELEDGQAVKVRLKGFDFPVQLLKKVFKNENGSTGVLYLVSNDLTKDADHLYRIYQKRWNIEVYHKSIKQNTSLAKSPTKTVRSQLNHIFASIVAFCKLEMLKVKTATNHFAIKYKLLIKANQATWNELHNIRKNSSSA